MIDNEISVDKIIEIESQVFMDYINDFQTEFECILPENFINFLKQYSGSYLNAEIDILEPNPFGNTVGIETIFGFSNDNRFDDIRENTRIGDGFPIAIPFASDYSGNWFYLYLGHKNEESRVLFFDIQNRYYWSDEEFNSMFENLAPEITEYLEKRKKGLIPEKKEAFNNFYLVGQTFDDFIKNLRAENYDDE